MGIKETHATWKTVLLFKLPKKVTYHNLSNGNNWRGTLLLFPTSKVFSRIYIIRE